MRERKRAVRQLDRQLDFNASETCVDLGRSAVAGGPAVFLALSALLGVGVAQPLVPRGVQFATVDPQIGVGTRVGAQLLQPARTSAATARRTFLVRSPQTLHPIASVRRHFKCSD